MRSSADVRRMAAQAVSLLLVLLVALSLGQELDVSPPGEIHRKAIDRSFFFTCSATGLESNTIDPLLKWFDKNNVQITATTGNLHIENEGLQILKLYFSPVRLEFAGDYRCTATLDGNPRSRSVELEVYKSITFDHAPSPQNPEIYTNPLIECRVSGHPTPRVSWRYRGQTITNNNKYQMENDGLRVTNISKADNGAYQCRAEEPTLGDVQNAEIIVDVYTPPTMVRGPGAAEGIAGHEHAISCNATAEPPPKYEFYKDGNSNPVSSTERISVDRDKGEIHFRPLTHDDRGSYRCVALNKVGSDDATGTLTVLVPPRITSYINVTGREGDPGELLCYSSGDPAPQMSFRKVGRSQDYDEGDNEGGRIRVTKEADGKLKMLISTLEPDDMANYTCKAVNTAGEHEQNGTMTVKFRPRFDEDHPRQVYSWAGKVRNLTCHVRAEPDPTIRWIRFERELLDNETYHRYFMYKSSNLQIRVQEELQGWIYGSYKCEAVNEMGTGSIDIELARATAPGAPESVSVIDTSPTRVTLVVEPPALDGGVEVLAYRVEFDNRVHDFNIGGSKERSPNESSTMLIENMRPSTDYVFQVRARNEVGPGNSKQFSYRTEPISKPYPIEIISDPVGIYPTSFTIRWNIPRTGGMPIERFRIKFRRVMMNNGDFVKAIDDWTTRDIEDDPDSPQLYYLLQGLRPASDYQVEVLAFNRIDWSNPHEPFYFSTDEEDGTEPKPEQVSSGGMDTGVIIAVVVVVFLLFLIIVDVSCYFMNNCGVTMCICARVCGKNPPASKEKVMEAGENERIMATSDAQEADETKVIEETEAEVAPPLEEQPQNDADEKKMTEQTKEPMDGLPQEDEESKEALKEELQAEDADESAPLTAETRVIEVEEEKAPPDDKESEPALA